MARVTEIEARTASSRSVSRRGRPPLSEAAIIERRTRIIDAAFQSFSTRGFTDTTLEAIGRTAGVTKRTIYELIGDKVALYRAACDRMRVRGPNFAFEIALAGRDAREVLHDMARQLVEHSMHPDLIALERMVIQELAHNPEMISAAVASGRDSLNRELCAILETLAADGRIPVVPFAHAADLFYDMTVGARGFRAVMAHPDERLSDADLVERADAFYYGYLMRHSLR